MNMNSETRNCQNCKNIFTIEPEDFLFYEKIKVPPPTFCPQCRMQRRMAFRNERTLFRQKCALTGKDIISCFSPESKMVVYDRDVWWKTDWDPLTVGVQYDFNILFFLQFKKLMERTPMPAVFSGRSENSIYGNYISDFKNAYLVSASNLHVQFRGREPGAWHQVPEYQFALSWRCSVSE